MVNWFFDDVARRPLKSEEYYRFCGPVFAANTVHSMTCMAIDRMTMTHLGTKLNSVDLHGKTRVYGTGEVLDWWLDGSSAPGHHFGLKFRLRHNALRSEVSELAVGICNRVNVFQFQGVINFKVLSCVRRPARYAPVHETFRVGKHLRVTGSLVEWEEGTASWIVLSFPEA